MREKVYSVSVIVPARNERQTIEELLRHIPSFPGACEVIFIEGHSTDGTLEKIRRVADYPSPHCTVRWAVQNGQGKADAVWKGFDLAQGDILMILDADLTVAPEELRRFYETVVAHPDALINGTRFVHPMERGAMRKFNYVGNVLFVLLLSFLCGRWLTDTLCGTKVLMKRNFERIADLRFFKVANDPFGDFSLLLGAVTLGMPIIEVPVRYRKRIYGSTKIRRFRDGWKLLKIALSYLFFRL